MIRLRSKKLMSGVSGLAVLASLGLISPALAAATYPGPTNYDPITNDQSGAGSTVLIGPDATVRANNPGNNDSFFNNLTMTGAGIKLRVQDSYLLGDIENTGTMQSSDSDAISIDSDSQVDGRIFNSGLIDGVGQGIEITGDSTLAGGINNTGSILGTSDGISLGDDSEIFGGIVNTGRIIGAADAGIDFDEADVEFSGGITNGLGGTISGFDAAIEWDGTIFSGGVNNTGLITGGDGIEINAGTFGGGITNNATTGTIIGNTDAAININGGIFSNSVTNDGLIRGTGVPLGAAIRINGGTILGEIQNNSSGVIDVLTAGSVAIRMTDGTIVGGIDNAGKILANAATGIGINITGATTAFQGGIENTGSIFATGADGRAIVISGGTFAGGINNGSTGRIEAGDTAVVISLATFNGDFVNAGTILSATEEGVVVGATTQFLGNFNNSGAIKSSANRDGVLVSTLLFTGDFTNSGSIQGANGTGGGTGVEISSATFDGNFINAAGGMIHGSNYGLLLSGAAFNGDITNAGTILADELNGSPRDAVHINSGVTVDGTFLNSGLIRSLNTGTTAASGEDGFDLNGTITGDLVNSGTIFGFNSGLDIDGQVEGDIINSGTIIGLTDSAIDLSGRVGGGAGHTVTQTAGLIQGRTLGGVITTALDMTGGGVVSDTFNARGGILDGNVFADSTDIFDMTGTSTFAYRRGTATGIFHFDVGLGGATTGTFILGADTRGGAGEGVTVNADHMLFFAGGSPRVYLDDDTTINLTNALTDSATSTLEWFLTTDTTNYGVINAATGTLAGQAAVFVDAADFANNPVPANTDIVYQDVINTSNLAGAFTNANTVTTSSVFFTATALEDADNNIDIRVRRRSFADALNIIGATETMNQNSVGGAIEGIYNGGAYVGGAFEDFFAFLFAPGTSASDIQNSFDEIAGAEHAQLQGASFRSSSVFNDALGDRLDQTLPTSTGTGFANLRGTSYADSGMSAADGMGSGGGGSHGLTRGSSGASIWVRGYGQWANVDTDPEAAGYDQDTTGVTGGVDFAVSNNATVGLAGSWSQDDVDFDTAGDTAEIDSWQIGGYGSYGFGRFYADGMVSYASHDIDATRTIAPPVPFAPFTASSSYSSSTWGVNGEVGMMWRLGRVNLQPSVGLAYANLSTDGFTEASLADAYELTVQSADEDTFASTVAIRASGQWLMGQTQIVPEVRLGWRHEFENDPMHFSATFNDVNSPVFQIIGSEIQEDSAVVRAGLTAGVTKNFEVFVDVNGQYNSDASATNASGGVRLTW